MSASTFLAGRTALVTGSTSGIGRGIAHALARAGADVMVHGLGDPAMIAADCAALAAETGRRIGWDAADLTSPGEVERLVAATRERIGPVDILVNNAGIQHVSLVEEFPPEKWEMIRSLMLDASFHAIRLTVAGMKQRGWGRIVNLASVHGLVASPSRAPTSPPSMRRWVCPRVSRWNWPRRASPVTRSVRGMSGLLSWKARSQIRPEYMGSRVSG